jgi:integrase
MAKRKPQRERGTGGLIKIKNCRYYYAQYYDENGRQRRVSTKTTSKQRAQGILRNLMSERDRGVQFIGDVRKLRYADLRKALLHNYVERGNKSLYTMADGTETICGLKALDEFFEYGEDKPGVSVARITTDAARDFTKRRLAQGAANDTVNGSLALLRRMLRIAHEDGRLHVVPKIRLLKAGQARKGFLNRDKFDELLQHIPENLKPLIIFLYFCGVRLGEATQINWSQVDLPAGVIRLESDQTKNSTARTVPIPDNLREIFEGMPAGQPGPKELVFDDTNLRKAWRKACIAAKLGEMQTEKVDGALVTTYNGLIVHDLRRSAVRNLIRAGVNEKVAMSISGHKTRSVFDRYNIVDEGDTVSAMRLLQNMPKSLTSDGVRTVKSTEQAS